ncbi:DUF2269 family protein [Nocardia araoensis]|uniref:DUF2269 family protein n=1 Tax=Nocardia araoensis TaxID=228600 RepID=UPI0002FAAE04|nr:hypothetical protein [Nocardia araoensis]
MTKALLAVHVLTAIIAIGPVTVTSSMFPPAARRAAEFGRDRDHAVVATLHRICRVYAGMGIAVPVFGFATASSLGVLSEGWLIASIALTAAAAAVLGLLVIPAQAVLAGENITPAGQSPVDELAAAKLAMYTGVFNLLWAVVTVLMIVRPGSTTGA